MKTTTKEHIVRFTTILAISVICFFIGRCGREKETTKPEVIYIKDKSVHTGTADKPVANNAGVKYIIRWKDSKVIHDTVPKKVLVVDSAMCIKIAEDYYSTYAYDRVLVDDSLLTFTLHDTTFMNRIQASCYEYKINRPQTIIINPVTKKLSVYTGVNIHYDNGFYPMATAQVNYDKFSFVCGLGDKCYNIGVVFKLF